MIGIIDGYTGKENVFADIIGEYNAALFGDGDYVLKVGESLGYSIVSNNEIDIKDGVFVMQGRRGHIKKGTTEICRIENGSQALKRNDLIVLEYSVEESTMVESFKVKVIKGTAGTDAVDPETVYGNIRNGAVLHQMPLYRVRIEGLNIVAVEQMFEFGSVAAETVNPMITTKEGFAADALKVKQMFEEQNSNFTNRINEVFQLGSSRKSEVVTALSKSNLGLTQNSSWEDIITALANRFPGTSNLLPALNGTWTTAQSGCSQYQTVQFSQSSNLVRYRAYHDSNCTYCWRSGRSGDFDVTDYRTLRISLSTYDGGSMGTVQLVHSGGSITLSNGDNDISSITGSAYIYVYCQTPVWHHPDGYDVYVASEVQITQLQMIA